MTVNSWKVGNNPDDHMYREIVSGVETTNRVAEKNNLGVNCDYLDYLWYLDICDYHSCSSVYSFWQNNGQIKTRAGSKSSLVQVSLRGYTLVS